MISLTTFILIILVLLVVLALPVWPYSRAYGAGPAALLTVLFVVVLILMLARVI